MGTYDFQTDVNNQINDAVDTLAEKHGVTREVVMDRAIQTLASYRDGSMRPAEPFVQSCIPKQDNKEPK